MFILEESLLLLAVIFMVAIFGFVLINNSKWFNSFIKKLRFKSEEELEEENKPNGKKRR